MIAITSFTVKKSEIDKMGIVHHSMYPLWFEEGRRDYFHKAGIPCSCINSLGYYLPLSEMECKFKSPAKSGDEIAVLTAITFMSCVKLIFEYKVLNKADGRILAVGKTIHAWTSKNIKPLNIEKSAPQIYELLKSSAAKKGILNKKCGDMCKR